MEHITKLRINDTDVFLENIGLNHGKITISNNYGHNYSYEWGAMGGTIENFILSINKEYFAGKLVGRTDKDIDVKKTFTSLKRFISSEFDLPYYKEMEFQKQMREILRNFQNRCEDNEYASYFVDIFNAQFIDKLGYYLLSDTFEGKSLIKNFKSISEPWHFLFYKPNKDYLWLERFHGELKGELRGITKKMKLEKKNEIRKEKLIKIYTDLGIKREKIHVVPSINYNCNVYGNTSSAASVIWWSETTNTLFYGLDVFDTREILRQIHLQQAYVIDETKVKEINNSTAIIVKENYFNVKNKKYVNKYRFSIID